MSETEGGPVVGERENWWGWGLYYGPEGRISGVWHYLPYGEAGREGTKYVRGIGNLKSIFFLETRCGDKRGGGANSIMDRGSIQSPSIPTF